MISIDEVRSLTNNIMAKQQSGFPSTAEFNRYANLANMDLYNYWNDIRRKQMLKVRTGVNITVPSALNPFLVVDAPISFTDGAATIQGGVDPTGLLSAAVGVNKTNVKIVDYDKRNNTLNSSIDGPTADKPVVMQNSFGFLVYPITIQSLFLTYLKLPITVKWDYTMVNNRQQYNPNTSVNFEWPATEKIKLVMKILSYAGMSVREGEIVQYAEQQQAISN